MSQFSDAELFGLPHSYYTCIARSYLRKQRWKVHEVSSRRDDFIDLIVPTIGRGIIPVLRFADGTLIQDSLDIIEAGEKASTLLPATPEGGKQELVSRIFFIYGSQALLKPAMHYRWSYYEDQKAFLDHAFGITDGSAPAHIMDKMKSYLPILGVTDETIPAIEESYKALLRLLDTHFAQYPYLLGGKPCIGDYGMFGPLFAHLGRDPVPEVLMKAIAPNVYRWVERMNSANPDMPEFPMEEVFLPGDEIPETLIPVLQFIAGDYGPELSSRCVWLGDYQRKTEISDGDAVSDKPSRRAIGMGCIHYRGMSIDVAIQPYVLYCLRRVQDAFNALNDEDSAWALETILQGDMAIAVDPELPFTVGRRDHIEVWEMV